MANRNLLEELKEVLGQYTEERVPQASVYVPRTEIGQNYRNILYNVGLGVGDENLYPFKPYASSSPTNAYMHSPSTPGGFPNLENISPRLLADLLNNPAIQGDPTFQTHGKFEDRGEGFAKLRDALKQLGFERGAQSEDIFYNGVPSLHTYVPGAHDFIDQELARVEGSDFDPTKFETELTLKDELLNILSSGNLPDSTGLEETLAIEGIDY